MNRAMNIDSLGFRTDLRLLEMTGSQIEDRGTHLVVRSPHNPTFHWGNFLLLRSLPVPGGEREVVAAFRAEFPEAEHVSVGIDGTRDLTEQVQPFADLGMDLDVGSVLATQTLQEPRPLPDGVEVRQLATDEEWESRARLGFATYGKKTSEATYLTFQRGRDATERDLVARGLGARFGAFVDGEVVSTAAVFLTHAGIARYQNVETHAEHRRQGLAANLVYAAGRHALDTFPQTTLVIVADHDGDAIRLYRSLGFVDRERHTGLYQAEGEWA